MCFADWISSVLECRSVLAENIFKPVDDILLTKYYVKLTIGSQSSGLVQETRNKGPDRILL